ncbi:MAG: hypothetical protein FJ314_09140 [SAR202 cluster bacterium]|nr:hypothetical protein [SAR202 cluster bacterium]
MRGQGGATSAWAQPSRRTYAWNRTAHLRKLGNPPEGLEPLHSLRVKLEAARPKVQDEYKKLLAIARTGMLDVRPKKKRQAPPHVAKYAAQHNGLPCPMAHPGQRHEELLLLRA